MSGSSVSESFHVERMDFTRAGEASSRIKRMLRTLGVDSGLIRRISIAAYELEINLVIHSLGGDIRLSIAPETITLTTDDTGPGIPDIALAMKEGYSTASEDARLMGFGAGMGLSNIRSNCDDFSIESEVDRGTRIECTFNT